jgi:hypothetical protein
MSLDDRDWYREAIREKQEQQDNPPPSPPRAAGPETPSVGHSDKPRWEPSWFVIPPIALLAGGLAYLLVFQVLSHFGPN